MRKVRLRIHVEEGLFGIRLTPSTRKRDPDKARKVRPHKLTAHQIDVWKTCLGENTGPGTKHIEGSLSGFLSRIRGLGFSLVDLNIKDNSVCIEIIK